MLAANPGAGETVGMHAETSPAARPLLAADEAEPCTVVNPDGRARVLLVADHASNRVPRALGKLGLDDAHLRTHIAWDIGSSAVAERLAERLDAPLVLAGYSRLVVDLNRSLSDPTSMPEVSDRVTIPGNVGLSDEARMQRVHGFFVPYRRAIDRELHRIRERGTIPALISIHSFTPLMANQRRPWHIGVLWDKDPRIPQPLLHNLRRHPARLVVGDNQPYSGRHPHDYTIDHHAEAAGLPHVSLEFRQDLVSEEAAARRWSDVLFECLEPVLADDRLYTLWQGH